MRINSFYSTLCFLEALRVFGCALGGASESQVPRLWGLSLCRMRRQEQLPADGALAGIYSPMVQMLQSSMLARTESMHRIEAETDKQRNKLAKAQAEASEAEHQATAMVRTLKLVEEELQAQVATARREAKAARARTEDIRAVAQGDAEEARKAQAAQAAEIEALRCKLAAESDKTTAERAARDAERAASRCQLTAAADQTEEQDIAHQAELRRLVTQVHSRTWPPSATCTGH